MDELYASHVGFFSTQNQLIFWQNSSLNLYTTPTLYLHLHSRAWNSCVTGNATRWWQGDVTSGIPPGIPQLSKSNILLHIFVISPHIFIIYSTFSQHFYTLQLNPHLYNLSSFIIWYVLLSHNLIHTFIYNLLHTFAIYSIIYNFLHMNLFINFSTLL